MLRSTLRSSSSFSRHVILAKAPSISSSISFSCGTTSLLTASLTRSAMEHPLILGGMAGLDPNFFFELEEIILSTLILMKVH